MRSAASADSRAIRAMSASLLRPSRSTARNSTGWSVARTAAARFRRSPAQKAAPRVLQQVDLPEKPVIVTEHRALAYWCPHCQKSTTRSCPPGSRRPAWSGRASGRRRPPAASRAARSSSISTVPFMPTSRDSRLLHCWPPNPTVRERLRRNATWKPVHRPSIPGDCNVDAVRSHNPGLAETPPCIPVTA